MRIRLILAIWACKLAIFSSRLLGKQGSSMPGQLAMTICPQVLELLSAQVKKDIIVVCGTNGKTTTNNLLSAFIQSKGYRVVCNDYGANMIMGVCCAFAEKADLLGRLNADYACLEVDEASSVKVLRHIKPTTMVITNLFRDQLDRYGEVELTLDYIRRALSLSPQTRLVLNGDDPLVAQLGENTDRICCYVGVDEDTGAGQDETREGRLCMFCGKQLSYEYYHYSQLGKFHCPGCGFRRHTLDFRVHDVELSNGLAFSLDYQGETALFQVNYRGFYNIYNIALSYCGAVLSLGEAPDHQAVLSAYQPQVGRMEAFTVCDKQVVLNLAKNPAGFNQAIAAVLTDAREKDVLIAVNDNPSDGRDISWLWDVDFERLISGGVRRLVVSGIRADELQLRMKYAGFAESNLLKVYDAKEALRALVQGEGTVCYALANYTATFPMQKILKELEGGTEHGA